MVKRVISLFSLLTLLFGVSALQVARANIITAKTANVSGTKSLVLSETRGMIYDRNFVPLVENSYSSIAVGKPTGNTIVALKNALSDEDFAAVSDKLTRGRPVAVDCGDKIFSGDDLFSVPVVSRYSDSQPAAHIIGYIGNGGINGVSGIEKSFDSFLSTSSGKLTARFSVDAGGRVLFGKKIEIVSDNYLSHAGVCLTIDAELQKIAETAMEKIEKGAAVLMDVGTGEIYACVSRPAFNPNNIAAAISENKGALVNRAFSSFCVGSVFKPLVAACALEQGADPQTEYYCSGSTKVGGVEFGCSGGKSHGSVNMAQALAYSCNGYFANLIQQLDCNEIIEKASALGFGKSISFADDLACSSGNLPESLDSAATKGNFSFGQGALTATPVQLALMYACLATNGCSREATLVKAMVDRDGKSTELSVAKAPYRLFSRETVEMLKTFLTVAVNEGTGKSAAVNGLSVAGKTATAQSGSYDENGSEILTSWFAGFFPADKPEYVLVVMCDGGSSGGSDCAPIFAEIAEQIFNKRKNAIY